MLRSAGFLVRLRTVAMAATGLVCVAYAALAVATGRPDPMSPWVPAALGLATAMVIFLAFLSAGRPAAEIATDEYYRAQNRRALAVGYWGAVLLYGVFAILLARGAVSFDLAFAIMGTLTGAAYLIPHAVLTGWRA